MNYQELKAGILAVHDFYLSRISPTQQPLPTPDMLTNLCMSYRMLGQEEGMDMLQTVIHEQAIYLQKIEKNVPVFPQSEAERAVRQYPFAYSWL